MVGSRGFRTVEEFKYDGEGYGVSQESRWRCLFRSGGAIAYA